MRESPFLQISHFPATSEVVGKCRQEMPFRSFVQTPIFSVSPLSFSLQQI